ncbi:MAG: ATP-binding protein [Chloroflexota bacterium]
MNKLRKRLRYFFLGHFYRFEGWRWIVIATVALGLFIVETYEIIQLSLQGDPFHNLEMFFYAILLVGNVIFIELFVRLNRIHKRMAKILEYKHGLSIEFSFTNDWETLIARLAALPGRIVDVVEETYLLVNNPIAGRFEAIAHWVRDERMPKINWDPASTCEKCFERPNPDRGNIHLCRNSSDRSPYFVYSLRMLHGDSAFALLKFRLQRGIRLTPNEEKIFNSVVDEIGIAILVGQDHKRIAELQSAEVAMAERRMISAYVHDQVGQNLGYLHLKLDQLSQDEYVLRSKKLRESVAHLRETANDSYEIVRDILKKIQPQSIPNLTNLLKEHASRVARAVNFALNFKSTGTPVELPAETQQAVFYAFHEIIRNVERHSRASTVDVLVTWSESFLDISVKDNGIGFDPAAVRRDEHFGLDIVQDRLAQLNGRALIDSASHAGTVISLSVPISS